MKTVSFYTLGCRSNQYETSLIKKMLSPSCNIKDGFSEACDIFIINSCLVTHDAERKSRQAIGRAVRDGKQVIVTGCYSDLEENQVKQLFPEVQILKKDNLNEIYNFISLPKASIGTSPNSGRIRANLMIENGCENYCAYCIVPFARGKIKSKRPAEVLCEAKQLVESGIKEIVLCGINLGAYQYSLVKIIDSISEIDNLLRVRLSSIEPMHVAQNLIKTIRDNPKACRHIHMPLQTADDLLLKKMGRNYRAKDYAKIVKSIRKNIPLCAISCDLIVGLPGETDAAFLNSINFIKEMKFSGIHLFPYSKRPQTKAFSMPDQIDPKTIKKRMLLLQDLRDKYKNEFIDKFSGSKVEVLVEKPGEGLTDNFIRVSFNNRQIPTGELYELIFDIKKNREPNSP